MGLRSARREDLAAVVAVMNAVDQATLGEPDTTETDIGAGWDEAGFDVERDAFVAEDGGTVVGYAEVYARGHGGVIDVDVFVHPDADAGLIDELLEAALRRVDEVATPNAVVSTWLPADDFRSPAFFDRGFTAERQFLRMRIDTAGAAPPPDVPGLRVASVRPGEDETAVHDVLVEAFSRHVRPVAPTFELFAEQHVNHPDYDPALWGLAWEGDTAVGALTLFDHGDVGFIRHVGVRRTHRGRGIATALILRGLAELRARGQTRVDLGVDLEDGSRAARLYERLGFRTVQRLHLLERRL